MDVCSKHINHEEENNFITYVKSLEEKSRFVYFPSTWKNKIITPSSFVYGKSCASRSRYLFVNSTPLEVQSIKLKQLENNNCE